MQSILRVPGRLYAKAAANVVTEVHLSCFFFSSRRRHTRWTGDWSSDVCSSDLPRSPPYRPSSARVDGPDSHRLAELVGILEHLLPQVPRERRVAREKRVDLRERAGARLAIHEEIGRASCRERV